MNKFFKKLGIFFLPIIIVVFFFEYNLSQIPTSYSVKKNYLEENISKIQILVLGSSHALNGINPEYFSKNTFNIANSSQSIYYDMKIFEKYVLKFKKLKKVIIPISYFSLEYNFSGPESWKEFFYKRVYGIDPEIIKKRFDIRNYSFLMLYGQIRAISYALKGFDVDLVMTMNKTGYVPVQEGIVKKINDMEAITLHESIMKKSNIDKNIEYLEKILTLARSVGIEPIFVTIPVSSSYYNNIDKEKYLEMQKNIKILSSKYNVKYFNYFFDERFTDVDFVNSDHLDAYGAEKFTKILEEVL
ncbi:MAG: hypothetical protein A2561_02495 [Candidatus Staskawiczbacteria bacterium RIFOXYD1_FULL_32_13]|uniref:SGNH hydrolase-type esterase domain-containing protein n=1 Tax=Candidatus Staskawiczbacteria bacterium RIFOXYD1_FULL_32_13 TaxID=1802234 RepID=A0A1G2JSN3_9BACT|nr:MAG: hypothetical protein UR22_C0012G0008 [Parcubacteria group bacterium GW2011_GWC2_32_10]OGZ77781.1 MAG: hypothetical protein A2256_03185 [Candidatus Staskawiczbacteria bacterium RIFOXYA2_FULL_32_7]OGZ87423.1 MAG: hypothetical protein A2463_00590 [Candidatus Staskawiczbacteria bacterium RIFOXYC2_FULL_32_10]OGZ89278.1 MAG: hypothetical protein A2561_02495 [Candidatus Staskawiczbacteria bacterium RIFOXYD1_FULL_32_13]